MAIVKFFLPGKDWQWYASEFDGVDTFYGWVSGLESEFGYFSLSELESVRDPLVIQFKNGESLAVGAVFIERDLYFKPTTFAELLNLHEGK